jgi:hypothetical protein
MTPIESVIYAILVLMVWSSLYRMTWIFRVAENMILGLYLGFVLFNGVDVIRMRVWNPIVVQGNWVTPIWIAVIFGILSWARLVKSTEFLSRWSMAFLTGIGSGIAVSAGLDAQIVKQLSLKSWDITNMQNNIQQIIILVCTITVLIYFSFSYKHTGVIGFTARLGRLFLMIGLGAVFGLMQMGNFAIPIGLLTDMSTPPGLYVLIIASLLLIVDIARRRAGIKLKLPLKKDVDEM